MQFLKNKGNNNYRRVHKFRNNLFKKKNNKKLNKKKRRNQSIELTFRRTLKKQKIKKN